MGDVLSSPVPGLTSAELAAGDSITSTKLIALLKEDEASHLIQPTSC